MNKLLRAIIPMALSACLLVPTGLTTSAATDTKASTKEEKRIVSYFPSWGYWEEGQQKVTVNDIPWDKVTHVNHGFFEISKDYKIQSTDPWTDFAEKFGHQGQDDWEKYPEYGYSFENPAGHFAEYKYYKSKYPNVKLLVSVGGWTRSEMFHEVAMDASKRDTLAQSMVDFLNTYPYFDGIDIDWEYPGISRDKDPNDEHDRGCPAGPEDKENFTLLLKDIRAKLDANNMKDKLLTVATSAGEEKIKNTNPGDYQQYVDYIGVMTYDFAGDWDSQTGHLAPLYSNPNDPAPQRKNFDTNYAMKLYEELGVPANKLLAGSPLYSRGWGNVEPGPNGDGLFQNGSSNFKGNLGTGGQYSYYDIVELEKNSAWTKYRDPIARVPYLYNKSLKQFITYEDEQSLLERVSYVNENKYGGLIVWDISGDVLKSGAPMHSLIYKNMIENQTIIEVEYEKEDVNKDRVVDINDLTAIASKYNISKNDSKYIESYDVNADGIIDLYDLVVVAKKLPSNEVEEPKPVEDTYDPNHGYSMDDTVIYGGKTYKSLSWWNIGHTPDTSPGYWQLVE